MNDREKQIERMETIIFESCEGKSDEYCTELTCSKCHATNLYNANCRILDKGSVVLTEEEFSEFRQTIITQSQEYTKLCDEMNDKIITARKQAVKEVLERLEKEKVRIDLGCCGGCYEYIYIDDINEIAKEFGVEVEE